MFAVLVPTNLCVVVATFGGFTITASPLRGEG
jgi:hypothetical protein